MAAIDEALALCKADALLKADFPTALYDRVRAMKLAPGALLARAPKVEDDPGSCFVVLWVEATRLWRLRQFGEFCKLVERMPSALEAMPAGTTKNVAAAYHCTMEAQKRHSEGDLSDAQQAAETAVATAEKLPDDVRNGPLPGAYNIFGEIVASREEEREAEEAAEWGSLGTHVETAIARIGDAILIRPKYAKYHATKARLESLQGRGPAATASIQRAMELEDPAAPDWPTRMLEYTAIRERNRMRGGFHRAMTAAEEAARAAEQAASDIKDTQTQLIAIVSLLAGVVALVVAGGSAGSGAPDSEQAATVVLALTLGIGWLIVLVGGVIGRTPPMRTIVAGILFGTGMAAITLLVKEVVF